MACKLSCVVLVLVHCVGALAENACLPRRDATMLSAGNRALRHRAYAIRTTGSAVLCARECRIDWRHCKSFNYVECPSKRCELSNSTRIDHPEDFIERQGSVYFDADEGTPQFSLPPVQVTSCKQILELGCNRSGVYTIYPQGGGLKVYCDMESDGGGWVVFQRRQDGSVDFYRGWAGYRAGFGDLSGEFWLGNDNLVRLSSSGGAKALELRVDLEDWDGRVAWAKYGEFSVSADRYALHFGEYDPDSTAGDSLGLRQRGSLFTTHDRDNDRNQGNCAVKYRGGFWFNSCWQTHLNGRYYPSPDGGSDRGIEWHAFRAVYSLKSCSMKIRETN